MNKYFFQETTLFLFQFTSWFIIQLASGVAAVWRSRELGLLSDQIDPPWVSNAEFDIKKKLKKKWNIIKLKFKSMFWGTNLKGGNKGEIFVYWIMTR